MITLAAIGLAWYCLPWPIALPVTLGIVFGRGLLQVLAYASIYKAHQRETAREDARIAARNRERPYR